MGKKKANDDCHNYWNCHFCPNDHSSHSLVFYMEKLFSTTLITERVRVFPAFRIKEILYFTMIRYTIKILIFQQFREKSNKNLKNYSCMRI